MSETVIKVENLSKVYKLYDKPIDRMKEALSISKKKYSKDHYALNNISFEIKRGDTVGIIGTNGSGKSTLLKIITGVLTQSFGAVEVNGKISALLELGAGFNPEYTGIENIYLNGMMMGYTKDEMDKRIGSIVEFADIGKFINQPVKTYSSGMFARLAFAVAINVDPDILIVDEALAVGDMRFQIKCMDRMKEMMDGGTTVIFVSHDVNSVRRFCLKTIWLHKGKMIKSGETNLVIDNYSDFLKYGEDEKFFNAISKIDEKIYTKIDKIEVDSNNYIADLISFNVFNKDGKKVSKLMYDEYIEIQIRYEVFDENFKDAVMGIAIKSIDDDYICGLNTLLDEIKIPWKLGMNIFKLKYPLGVRVLGGNYYFDFAIFDRTATVPFIYLKKIKNIIIESGYVGEGRLIIPHKWEEM